MMACDLPGMSMAHWGLVACDSLRPGMSVVHWWVGMSMAHWGLGWDGL